MGSRMRALVHAACLRLSWCWSAHLQTCFLPVIFCIFSNLDAACLAADSEGLKKSNAKGHPAGAQHLLLRCSKKRGSQHPQPILRFTWEALYADYLKMASAKQTKLSPRCCVTVFFSPPLLSHKNGSLVLSVFHCLGHFPSLRWCRQHCTSQPRATFGQRFGLERMGLHDVPVFLCTEYRPPTVSLYWNDFALKE